MGDLVLCESYYKDKLLSYNDNLKIIIIALVKWLRFLYVEENKINGENKIHSSLKELSCKGVI